VRTEAVLRNRIQLCATLLGKIDRDLIACDPSNAPALSIGREALIAELTDLSREVRAMREAYILIKGR
jgi:hypothetical protein